MKNFILCSLAIGVLFFTSCGSESKESISKPTPPKSEGPVRVLFVGNSHTEYYASFPKMLEALTKANNKQVEVFTLIEMGVSIDKILSANQDKADQLFAKTDADGNFLDYIILQESTPVAIEEEDEYKANCKTIHDLVVKNSPDVATYIYELAVPLDYTDSDYKEYQKILTQNAMSVVKSLPNAGKLPFAQAIKDAYEGKEGYSAEKDGKDVLRFTDNSHHMLNDAVFMNSIILYQYLFNETPQIPQQLPLGTGTGDDDKIVLMNVSEGVSNPSALEKIAASYK